MADPLPAPTDTAIATSRQVSRLWTLTLLSLSLNFIIIVLIVVGAIIHHHQMHRPFGGDFGRQMAMMRYMKAQRFGGPMGMNRGSGPTGGCPGCSGGPGGSGGAPSRGLMGSGGPDNAPPNDAILAHLTQALALTDDEKAKIKPIIDSHIATVQKQMEAQRVAIKQQVDDAKSQMKAVLTPDQQKQLDALPLPGDK